MEYKDYYKILGVDKNADQKTIQESYRKLARKFHPDLNPGNKRAEEKFKEINEAYEVLSDQNKRSKYDQLGANWQNWEEFASANQGGAGPYYKYTTGGFDEDIFGRFGGFSDFFKTFFGREEGFETNLENFSPESANLESLVELDLKDAYLGGEKTFQLQIQEGCSNCGGRGVLHRNVLCNLCNGSGVVIKQKRLTVRIPAGIKDGSKIRISGQGKQTRIGKRGDLYLRIKIKPHHFFELKGNDLHCEVPVTIYELLLGANINIPTFKGKVTIKIPEGTQNGSIFRLKNLGFVDAKGVRGNLMVKLKAYLPTSLSSKEKNLFEELKKYSKDVPHRNLSL